MSQQKTDIPQADFHDKRIDMAYWFPKLRELDVPVPESQPIPLERQEEGPPEWDTDFVSEVVENLGGEAFARSGFKSAQMHLHEGSYIQSPNPEEVDRTLTALLSQHFMMGMPLGKHLWVREWLDVNHCHYSRDNLVPETRAFIRDGEVVCHHPRLEGFEDHPDHREVAEELIEGGWNPREPAEYERDVEIQDLNEYAQRVAEAFDGDGWWSVDFVMDTDGNWWLTDMALDAVYDLASRGEEGWSNISEHPGDCPHDLEAQLRANRETEP